MQTLESITNKYPISSEEYEILDSKFGKLCHYAAWQLKKRNSKNSMVNDPEDDVQELRIALMRAGSYYKRQLYIQSSFRVLEIYVADKFNRMLLKQLIDLWQDRRRHGANRQKFGEFQEVILEHLVRRYVPLDQRPDINTPIKVDVAFSVYAKRIIWNAQKALGKQITREKSWRSNLVSLSEYDYLAHT